MSCPGSSEECIVGKKDNKYFGSSMVLVVVREKKRTDETLTHGAWVIAPAMYKPRVFYIISDLLDHYNRQVK